MPRKRGTTLISDFPVIPNQGTTLIPQNPTGTFYGTTHGCGRVADWTHAAAVKWEASARAAYYRVYVRLLDVDADYRAVGSPADLDFTIENLPANATVNIIVTAVNNGGEGTRLEPIRIVTH